MNEQTSKDKSCPNCGHRAHYALRCGAVIALGGECDFAEELRCECLNWASKLLSSPAGGCFPYSPTSMEAAVGYVAEDKKPTQPLDENQLWGSPAGDYERCAHCDGPISLGPKGWVHEDSDQMMCERAEPKRVPEPVPPGGAAETRHIHNCIRCGLDFECRNEGQCAAQYRVLPKIVQGYELLDHCPPNPTWDEIRELISQRIQQYDNRQQAVPPCWKDIPVTWADGTTGMWKCRKERGHSGVCAPKNCCDARDPSGDRTFCGFADNHAGKHAWELPKSLPEPLGTCADISGPHPKG